MRILLSVVVASICAVVGAAVAVPPLGTPRPTPEHTDWPHYRPRDNCLLRESTLERFTHATFYSWHPARNATNPRQWEKKQWAQMGQESVISDLVRWHNVTGRSSMLEIQGFLFEPIPPNKSHISPHTGRPIHGFQVRADWVASWDEVVAQLRAERLVERGVITGFMLGDEMVWNNITWDQLNDTSAYVKATVPEAYIMYTEGSAPLWGHYNVNRYRVAYPHVPKAIDYFSFDDYANMYRHYRPAGHLVYDDAWHQYHAYIYDRKLLLPHQSVWVIPPAYGDLCPQVGHVPVGTPACDDFLLNQTYAFLDWIDRDAHVTGSDAYHGGLFDDGMLRQPKTLACWKQLSAQLIAYQNSSKTSL